MSKFNMRMCRGRVAILAGGLGLAALAWGCGGKGEAANSSASRPARAASVEVATVEAGSIARSLTVSGVVEPIRTVGVNSQLSGAILSIHAEEGNQVQRGDLLARLDDRELQAQFAAAEASFQVTESAFERAKQLRDRNVITLPEYERERTAYSAAKAQRDQLHTRLEFATVNAPITGVVTEKDVEAGDIVAPQTRLFTLADVSTMVVRVQISELDVVDLQAGDELEVILDAIPDRHFQGRIRRIFPAADPATRLVPVEVALEGETARLARPGFLARTTFALGVRENVLLISASALVRGAGSAAVFVVEEGKARRRIVTTGLTSQGRVEITSGLAPGDVVVTVGNNALQDGANVRIVDRNSVAKPDSAAAVSEKGR
ncbi:MAG: efflux RND transporter periplasmic adaptor subunit [Candidatus Eisenbacteria bacterium]|uniref:Efflux RND transporter periplasmic adaptor subunit n=1 Tax=Eiseniibacteriota bacterium TaxID=2212470 RepID=A0A948RXE7_UNCEI|nr:efflux RND transporter periplasmic adaptor subunit [Candidatus Eisenbacteria bacterium]MBU1948052.1 efflux RND transporter periplasmic adaptor subunit [Candidatus Eisenbacteria bacterium]MBU2690822.1 efflux RND transporter periplasmic adaptor subunit [Candidatus Eisenbacteria bacterium]